MNDDEIRKVVTDLYFKLYGTEPTNEQAQEFIKTQIKPVIDYLEAQRNELK